MRRLNSLRNHYIGALSACINKKAVIIVIFILLMIITLAAINAFRSHTISNNPLDQSIWIRNENTNQIARLNLGNIELEQKHVLPDLVPKSANFNSEYNQGSLTDGNRVWQIDINGELSEKDNKASNNNQLEIINNDLLNVLIAENKLVKPEDNTINIVNIYLIDSDYFALWESDTKIYVSNNQNQQTLKEKPTNSAVKSHNLKLFVGSLLVINALSTGEAWIYDNNQWNIVPSTKNNWQIPTQNEKEANILVDAKENICPVAGVINTFGVRSGKYSLVPAIYAAIDANQDDQLFITNILNHNFNSSEAEYAPQIVDGKYIGINIAKGTIGSRNISFNVSDLGSDSSGTCETTINITLNIIEENAENHPPLLIGRQLQEKYRTLNYERIGKIDLKAGYYDPDGDTIFATNLAYDDNLLQGIISDNGILSLKAKQNIEQTTQISYQICDIYSCSDKVMMNVLIRNALTIFADDIFIKTTVGSENNINLLSAIHGSSINAFRVITAHPPEITAIFDEFSGETSIKASKTGTYILNYSCNVSKLCDGQIVEGRIIVKVDKEEEKTNQTSTTNTFAQKINYILIHDEEGKTISLDNLISNLSHIKYNIKNTKVSIKNELDNITANLLSDNEIYLDAVLNKPFNSPYLMLGALELDVSDESGKNEVLMKFEIIAQKLPQSEIIAPIANDDLISVIPRSLNKLDVLKNDLFPSGSSIKIDKQYFNEQNNTKNIGVIIPDDMNLNYIPPENLPNGTKIEFKYRIYNEYCPKTCRDLGVVKVLIQNKQLISSANSSGALSANAAYLEKFAKSTIDSTETIIDANDSENSSGNLQNATKLAVKPVGIRDRFFGKSKQKIKLSSINPLENDFVPNGCYAKENDIRLNVDSESESISDIANYEITIGEISDKQIYELSVDIYSDGTNPLLGEKGTMISSYTERLVFEVSIETIENDISLSDNVVISSSDILLDMAFQKDISLNEAMSIDESSEQQSSIENKYEILCAFSCDLLNINENDELTGNITDLEQIFAIKTSIKNQSIDESDSNAETENITQTIYTTVLVPSISGFKPIKKNNELKSVKVGESIDYILADEILIAPNLNLTINNQNSQINAKYGACTLRDGVLTYVAPTTIQADDYLIDLCSIKASYLELIGSENDIYFKTVVTSNKSLPKLAENINLTPLAPKESTSVDLQKYIMWLGHDNNQIGHLRAKCSTEDSENITANCNGLELNIEANRTAKELSNNVIKIRLICENECNKHSSFGETNDFIINQPIKMGAKFTDIQLPTLTEPLIIDEGKNNNSAVIDVLPFVRDYLNSAQYYGFAQGGKIYCGETHNIHLTCEEGESIGKLKFTVMNATNGMNLSGVFKFTDRDENQMPNYGSGTVIVQFRALPKTPSTPQIDEISANSGNIILNIEESVASIPEVTSLCIRVINESNQDDIIDKCKTPQNGVVDFSSDNELYFLNKWQPYSVSAYSRNIVGESTPTNSIIITTFTPIGAPNVKWYPIAEGQITLAINDTMPTNTNNYSNVASYEIANTLNGLTITLPNNISGINETLINSIELGINNNRFTTISVKACGKAVISGTAQINTGCSPNTNVNVFTSGKFGGDDLLENTQNLGDDNKTINDATFKVRPNSKLISSVLSLLDTNSITYSFRFFGDCRNDNAFVPLNLSSLSLLERQNSIRIAELFGEAKCDSEDIARIIAQNEQNNNSPTSTNITLHQSIEIMINYNVNMLADIDHAKLLNPPQQVVETFTSSATITIPKDEREEEEVVEPSEDININTINENNINLELQVKSK